jgi:hypothetical protein
MAILLNDAVFKTHTLTSGTNAPLDQARKNYRSQEARSYRIVLRITVLPLVLNSWHVGPIQVVNLRLLQLRNSCNFFFSRSCTNVFSRIGVELGDRSLFRCLLDIVDVIANDLLRLRVVDHH